jgi:hypothetical protein
VLRRRRQTAAAASPFLINLCIPAPQADDLALSMATMVITSSSVVHHQTRPPDHMFAGDDYVIFSFLCVSEMRNSSSQFQFPPATAISARLAAPSKAIIIEDIKQPLNGFAF